MKYYKKIVLVFLSLMAAVPFSGAAAQEMSQCCVRITEPAAGSTITRGSTIKIAAEAIAGTLPMEKIVIITDLSRERPAEVSYMLPYSFNAKTDEDLLEGEHVIVVIGQARDGMIVQSEPVRVIVKAAEDSGAAAAQEDKQGGADRTVSP